MRSRTTIRRTTARRPPRRSATTALVASLTFLAIAGRQVQLEIFHNFDVADQPGAGAAPRPEDHLPPPDLAGDKLYFDSYLDIGDRVARRRHQHEIRGEVTDDDGKPVITSIVTVIGESAHDDEADEVSAAIKTPRRRHRENDCRAKL